MLRTVDDQVGASWWSRRFIALLESFGIGSRLERGLAYARSGQVSELDVEPGIALAKVQGSRFTPYRVRIRPQPFSEHQWRRAEKAIAARALTLATLLAGEMPPDIEEVLADVKLSLLPSSYEELRASCTCPDAANPCKHTAAVYYVLAERLDEEPFALFTLRGRTEEELLERLRSRRAKATRARAHAVEVASGAQADEPEPLPETLDRFWCAGPELAGLHVSPFAAEGPDALLRRLGSLSLEAGLETVDLAAVLGPTYARLAAAAERRALSD
ncbi:MAG TPA: SWIM zinc finger family protein [Solirubrobacteraceae bacterium]|nr:SWIM zinc finger family protein [Solirubrobacteraceae bacterium]